MAVTSRAEVAAIVQRFLQKSELLRREHSPFGSELIKRFGKNKNPLYSIEEIGKQLADALFLDVELPGMKGNDAARAIQTINPNMHIVFTTAYAKYAIEAFR